MSYCNATPEERAMNYGIFPIAPKQESESMTSWGTLAVPEAFTPGETVFGLPAPFDSEKYLAEFALAPKFAASLFKSPSLPTDAADRKATPVYSGVLKYFPLALAEVARVSKAGNDQHNPGEPLHWARGKSTDHADCATRHLMEVGTIDTDGQRHSAKLAWRALALLQEELEAAVTHTR